MKERLAVVDNGIGEAVHRDADAVVGGVFAGDDGERGVAHVVGDGFFDFVVPRDLPLAHEGGDRHPGDERAAPAHHGGVAVFAHDVGVDVARVHSGAFADELAEAGAVEDGAGAHHQRRVRVQRAGDAGHDVHRVGDKQHDRIGCGLDDLRHDAGEDGGVARQQVQPRFARFLVGAGGDDDQRGTGEVFVVARVGTHAFGERRAVGDVGGFGLGTRFVAVNQHDFATGAVEHHCVCGGGADESGADDSYFCHGFLLFVGWKDLFCWGWV